MILKLASNRGITMLELMIATLLIGLVFAVSMSIYSSSYRFLNLSGASSDPTQNPVVALEDISKRISLCNDATLTGSTVLHLRCDYQEGTYTARNTPANTADDSYWHYNLTGGQLIMLSNTGVANAGTVPTAGANGVQVVIPNVNTTGGSSQFALSQASGAGTASTKVDITVTTTATASSPANQVRTSAVLGAKATR